MTQNAYQEARERLATMLADDDRCRPLGTTSVVGRADLRALLSGPPVDREAVLSEREAMLFDLAWNLVVAVRGGGTLPHFTPEQRADEAAVALTYLLDARNERLPQQEQSR